MVNKNGKLLARITKNENPKKDIQKPKGECHPVTTEIHRVIRDYFGNYYAIMRELRKIYTFLDYYNIFQGWTKMIQNT